jgi:hypothetical protein
VWALCIAGKFIGPPIAGATTNVAAATLVAPKQDIVFFITGSSLMKRPLLIQQ